MPLTAAATKRISKSVAKWPPGGAKGHLAKAKRDYVKVAYILNRI